ncbi:golgin candidate 4-like protein, partial [Trifolium pratense]
MDSSKRLIDILETENTTLKIEKSELEATLKASKVSFTGKKSPDASQVQNRDSSSVSDLSDPSKSFPGKEDMEISLQKMSDDLKKTQQEKDKA